jgi:DNA recombination-dependent growth factor C
MGALKGSITVRRYQVRGPVPTTDRILKGIRAHAQAPIDPMSDIEKAVGWANAEDPSDCDLSAPKVFKGESVMLGLRVDTLKPPTPVVKRLVAEKLKELGRRPNRTEKQAAKDEVMHRLRARYYPSIKSTDLVWDVQAGRVLFWSHGKQLNEWLTSMFAKSFGLELVPLGPGLAVEGIMNVTPTPEMLMGFPGSPGRPVAGEDGEGSDE